VTLVGGTEFQLLESNLANLIIHTEGRRCSASSGRWVANSIRFFANLLPSTLSRQGLFNSALRARLQIEGVALHFLDDVFRLNLALEATECVVYRLAFLQPNFCQSHPPPTASESPKISAVKTHSSLTAALETGHFCTPRIPV
jgi:hypothetical protein